MADRFYTSSPLAPGPIFLQGPEAHHLATIRRFHIGDQIVLFNGDGSDYLAKIIEVGRKQVSLEVLRAEPAKRELPHALQVAAPLPKGDRGDFLVEKLTELGVTDFVPLHTERSVVHPRDTKLERLQRAVIEASKQCGRNVLMRIHPLEDWQSYCRRPELPSSRLLAHCGGESPRPVEGPAAIAVGPEGGFTDAEVELGRSNGWRVVTLGARTLRVETAAIALASLLAVRI